MPRLDTISCELVDHALVRSPGVLRPNVLKLLEDRVGCGGPVEGRVPLRGVNPEVRLP